MWLIHLLGVDTQQSWAYDAWSGCIPALLTGVGLWTGLIGFYLRHNCHVHRCWRFGRHPIGKYTVCHRHHPDRPRKVTAEHVAEAHRNQR